MDNIIFLEYIWLDKKNNFRSKTKVINLNYEKNLVVDYYNDKFLVDSLPIWNYDGSSTGQANGEDSEILLRPVVIFSDPFRKPNGYLVWCDWLDKNEKPLMNCHRPGALKTFNEYKSEESWYGLEQEYFIINPINNLPLGFDINKNPEPQGEYYCGIGANKVFAREFIEKHMQYCLYSGIKLAGINAEVAPGQWEYQIGPCLGISGADHLWMSRYILNRLAEEYGYSISYHPKPLGSDKNWNGSGCHTNFSTKSMRENGGIKVIHDAICKLAKNHTLHMANYGTHNELRMTGNHETSSYHIFSSGRANRSASVRIPNQVSKEGKGYFEDRRPASNCDPYLVCPLILNTVMDQTSELPRINSLLDLGFVI
jgi:glutamine synthetase